MDRQYWRVRRANFEQLSSLPVEAQSALSAIDVALDAYWPDDDPDRPASPFSITEGQMRSEVEVAMAQLRALDLLED